jgi:hypothetical protein
MSLQQSHEKSCTRATTIFFLGAVAFCLKNNHWKNSPSFLKDRSRFLNCIRICKETLNEERLSDLKAGRPSRGSQGDLELPLTNLKPVRGAVVKVRFEEDEEIKWLQGKLIDVIQATGQWIIKLVSSWTALMGLMKVKENETDATDATAGYGNSHKTTEAGELLVCAFLPSLTVKLRLMRMCVTTPFILQGNGCDGHPSPFHQIYILKARRRRWKKISMHKNPKAVILG